MKNLRKMRERITSIVLSFVLVMSLFVGLEPMDAYAEESTGTFVYKGVTYTPMGQNSLQTAGNYYLTGDVTLNSATTIRGTVNLCLNGYVLKVSSDGITVPSGAVLNIYDGGTTVHKYQSSASSCWTQNSSGDKEIVGGILYSKITNQGTFNLNEGTICGVSGVAINNKGIASIGEKGAVIGNYNSNVGYDDADTPTTIPAIVYNGKNATFSNNGKINNNVSILHTVSNDGGTFRNETTGTINDNIATSTGDGTAAGGVINYTRNTSYISKFHNYGQINSNTSQRSSGGVLNKGGEFTNYETGQINGNVAARHCGGVDNTSRPLNTNSDYSGTFFKNYGQVNGNKVTAQNGGGDGAGIYNEVNATIYNYGEVCNNTAIGQGGGIFFNSGTLIVGGKSKVTGNKDTSGNNSNICIGSGKTINFDSNQRLADEADMGVYIYYSERVTGKVTSGYSTSYGTTDVTNYFFADTQGQEVKLQNGELYLSTHSHSLETVPEVSATCTEGGNIAYYKCISKQCEKLFENENATTTITEEATKIAPLGHDWSGEWTVVKEATATKEGKKQTLCTRGCGQKKVAMTSVIGANDDNSNVEKGAEVSEDSPIQEVTLNNPKEELLGENGLFDDDEKQLIEAGQGVRVWLEISELSDIPEDDKNKIEQKAANMMSHILDISYFDAKLFKQIGSEEAELVSNPSIPIKMAIKIPDNLRNTDISINREYKILRLHEGESEVAELDGTFDEETGEFSFETDKFSTYAVVYKDTPVQNNGDGGSNGANGDGGNGGSNGANGDGGNGGSNGANGDGENSGSSGATADSGNSGSSGATADSGNSGSSGTTVDSGNSGSNGTKGNGANGGNNGTTRSNGQKENAIIDNNRDKYNDDKKYEAPDTGDSNNALYSLVLMLLSGLGIIFCSRRKEIYSKDN